MSQLSLNIRPTLSYAATNFVPHAGVEELTRSLQSLLSMSDRFRIALVTGDRRTGKTHLSLFLAEWLTTQGKRPILIEGAALLDGTGMRDAGPDEVIIVDDADEYLKTIEPGAGGPFVRWIELLRVNRAALVLLSSTPLESFGFDGHVRSRLLPGSGFTISAPSAKDIPLLVEQMARQRGIAFRSRMVGFIEKRVSRTVPAIEGYLERLSHLSRAIGKPIRFPLLGDAL